MARTKILRTAVLIFILIAVFNVFKAAKQYFSNIGLPKGKIIFSTMIDGDFEIYSINLNGFGLRKLTNNSGTRTNSASDTEPSFSPDGKKIVFVSDRQEDFNRNYIYNERGKAIGEEFSGGGKDIFIMDSDGKNQTPLTSGGINLEPFFTPDGNKIVYRTNGPASIRMVDIDGRRIKVLNNDIGQVQVLDDGRSFDNFWQDICISEAVGFPRKKLTDLSAAERKIHFCLSKDNSKLAIVTSDLRQIYRLDNVDDFYRIFSFYVLDLNTDKLVKVYEIDGSNIEETFWSPEYVADSVGVSISYKRLPDGRTKKVSWRSKDLRGVSGRVHKMKFSPNGDKLFFVGEFRGKHGIYCLDLETKIVEDLLGKKEDWSGILDFAFTPDSRSIVFVADVAAEDLKLPEFVLFFKAMFCYLKGRIPDKKYICIMDIDGSNYRRVAKLPDGTSLARDFIHWEGQ